MTLSSEKLDRLQTLLNHRFKDQDLLIRALTHSSTGLSSIGEQRNYERLEFLGDRVLGLVMADMLFTTFPDETEGGLAKRHSALVQGRTLYDIGLEQGLGEFVNMSESERAAGGEENENIIADVMESLLGALYLDGGIEAAHAMIENLWGERILVMSEAPQDPKTALQEWAQARGLPLPVYEIIEREGPDHAPLFTIQVSVEGRDPVTADGQSRRQAEKKAAKKMLQHIQKGDA